MSNLKSLELRNREHGVEEVRDFVADIATSGAADRSRAMVGRANQTGLM
jgi:hypothetical protein